MRAFRTGDPILAIMRDGREIVGTIERTSFHSLIQVRLENGMIQNLRHEELEGIYHR